MKRENIRVHFTNEIEMKAGKQASQQSITTKYTIKKILSIVLHRNSNASVLCVVRSSDCILDFISPSLALRSVWMLYSFNISWTIDWRWDFLMQVVDRTMFDFEAVVIGTYVRVHITLFYLCGIWAKHNIQMAFCKVHAHHYTVFSKFKWKLC